MVKLIDQTFVFQFNFLKKWMIKYSTPILYYAIVCTFLLDKNPNWKLITLETTNFYGYLKLIGNQIPSNMFHWIFQEIVGQEGTLA